MLPDSQIHTIFKEHFNAIVYQGPEGELIICHYKHDEHFDVITKVTGFLDLSYFCLQTFKKGYNNKENTATTMPVTFVDIYTVKGSKTGYIANIATVNLSIRFVMISIWNKQSLAIQLAKHTLDVRNAICWSIKQSRSQNICVGNSIVKSLKVTLQKVISATWP